MVPYGTQKSMIILDLMSNTKPGFWRVILRAVGLWQSTLSTLGPSDVNFWWSRDLRSLKGRIKGWQYPLLFTQAAKVSTATSGVQLHLRKISGSKIIDLPDSIGFIYWFPVISLAKTTKTVDSLHFPRFLLWISQVVPTPWRTAPFRRASGGDPGGDGESSRSHRCHGRHRRDDLNSIGEGCFKQQNGWIYTLCMS